MSSVALFLKAFETGLLQTCVDPVTL